MITQIVANMRKQVSDRDFRDWLHRQAELAEARGDYQQANCYRQMELEDLAQQRAEAETQKAKGK